MFSLKYNKSKKIVFIVSCLTISTNFIIGIYIFNYYLKYYFFNTTNFEIFILILLNRDEDEEKPSSFESELATMDLADDDFLDETLLIGEV